MSEIRNENEVITQYSSNVFYHAATTGLLIRCSL